MDIALMTAFLAPFLPHLLKLGGQAASTVTEVVAANFGEAAWGKAQKIWGCLEPKVEDNEELKIAATQVASKPDSSARQAVFQEELEVLLSEYPDLATAITQIMEEKSPDGTPGTQIVQNIVGDRNQVIGQVFGGFIVGNAGDVNLAGNPTTDAPPPKRNKGDN
ncbi:MAG: hypothetical protein F6K00_30205 [Leptolyngbya sp. SIOISBB]|nr:hypothetical protein [Leptolyngbya sp. SIOISBB]